ncbi:histone-lysine N-methyltransferase NSD2-like [Pollicipes pollicipes]|uniref:histone-lysine N-methyltransferase NSD2-like n=1 Tax=Pollicipes pollicipes TaxID=41117 RepID=UPI0018854A19|nr:histone-lysine N-methyltransferase NSD2-like [Pollicipes pollicipes]
MPCERGAAGRPDAGLGRHQREGSQESGVTEAGPGARAAPDSSVPCDWLVGDVVWARVSGYPLWPAIVLYDTGEGQFTKVVRKAGCKTSRRYHVRFFGDLCRGWIHPNNLRPFEGRAQFDQLARAEQAGPRRVAGKESSQFRLSSRNLPKWLTGVAEATASAALERYERVKPFVAQDEPGAPAAEPEPAPAPKPKPRRRKSAPASVQASATPAPSATVTASSPAPGTAPSTLCEENGELGRELCAGAPASAVRFSCAECLSGQHVCFVCKSASGALERCGWTGRCGKHFHRACLRLFPQATSSEHRLVCPLHVCHTCVSEDPRRLAAQFKPTDKLFKCVRCPTAYHASERCVAAGTEILNASQIICTKHYGRDTKRGSSSHHINTTWCFICSKGGSLICCESCPASFHVECINAPIPDGGYVCEECESGRFPLYGEVVWVKLGFYRWWPAMVVPPNDIPENLLQMEYSTGQFVVRFFGSKDYTWMRRGRVFLFEEGDSVGRVHATGSKTLTSSYKKAMQEATVYYKQYKESREKQREATDILRPPAYIRIKSNKPVGGVKLSSGDVSQATACGCRPTDERPADAHVRVPPGAVSSRRARCLNQRFQKRLYPPLQVVRTSDKGWGLAALVDLKKGDFVIEYVGEVISEAELQRRVEYKHRMQDDNYYFLTVDKDRILDAGPKGNQARFMNHCCQPNCETQKWTINSETRVGLFAITDIPAGEELNFNYNFDCVGTAKKRCMCGAPNCSGYLGDKALKVLKTTRDDKTKRAKRRRRRRPAKPRSEDDCFRCGLGGQLILCDFADCPKAYHASCLQLDRAPYGKWVCPWHHCDICGQRAVQMCVQCPNSLCKNHLNTSMAHHPELGDLCDDHEPAEVAQMLTERARRREDAPEPPLKRPLADGDGGDAKRPRSEPTSTEGTSESESAAGLG